MDFLASRPSAKRLQKSCAPGLSGANEGRSWFGIGPVIAIWACDRRGSSFFEFGPRAITIHCNFPAFSVRLASASTAVRPTLLLRPHATRRAIEVQGDVILGHLCLIPMICRTKWSILHSLPGWAIKTHYEWGHQNTIPRRIDPLASSVVSHADRLLLRAA